VKSWSLPWDWHAVPEDHAEVFPKGSGNSKKSMVVLSPLLTAKQKLFERELPEISK
jgi:hypothetical protein